MNTIFNKLLLAQAKPLSTLPVLASVKYLAIFMVSLLCWQTSNAAQLLFSTAPSYDVSPSLEVLHDTDFRFNISRLQSDLQSNIDSATLWRKYNKDSHTDYHSRHVCWFRFSVTNILQQEQEALLVLPNPNQKKISVYIEADGDTQAYHTGSLTPFDSRPIEHEDFLFPVTLPASSDATIYIKLTEGSSRIVGNIELWRFADYFMQNGDKPDKWVFIGALGFSVAFLIAHAFRWRQYDYLVLALFVFSTLASMLVYYGFAYRYIWPSKPELNYQSLYFFVAMAGASLLRFHSDFCRFQLRHRLAYIGSNFASCSLLCIALITIWTPYQGETRLLLLLGVTVIFLLWQLSVLIRHEFIGNHQHRPILVAWSATLVFALFVPLIKQQITSDLVPDNIELIILTLCMSLTVILLRQGDKSLRDVTSSVINMQVRDELMSRMNFEVRTPMNAILGAADLLKGSQLTRSQRQYTELLHVSSHSLLRVVNDILDYPRLKSGKLVLHRKSFDFSSLLNEIPTIFSLRAMQKNIHLFCHFDRTLPLRVLGDDNRLQQLLVYLMDYAIKSTNKGAVVLLVYPDPKQAQHILFSLEGNMVFQGESPFDLSAVGKLEHSFDDKVAFGEGVNNNIINQLIELMGADYQVLEGNEQAQRLEVSIPLPTVEQAQTQLQPLKGANIGWIGSDSLYASMLEKASEQEGVEFYPFGSINAFVRAIESNTYDLDCVLCHGDELDSESIKLLNEACSSAANHNENKMKVVALCDSAQALDWAEQQLVFFDLVSNRPVVINRLFDQLVKVLQSEESGLLEQDLSSSSLPRLNILVAEDNEVNIMVLDRMLNRLGHQVSLVKNGALAIELYRHCMGSDERWQHFDLILMDCEMPEVDGLQAARKIRELEAEAGETAVPIIALTAHGLSKIESQCMSAGMNLVLAKPVGLEKLNMAIERTVDLTKLVNTEK